MTGLTSFFDLLHSYKDKTVIPQESVLLNIRARGIENQKRNQTFRGLLLSIPLVFLMDLAFLPFKCWLNIKSILFGAIVSTVLYVMIDVVDIYSALIIFTSIICIINFLSIAEWIQGFVFDLLDLLTFASLTRLWVLFYFANKYVHKEYTATFNYSLISHIFQTRHHWGSTRLQAEEDSFLNKIESLSDNPYQLHFEVNKYWSELGYE